MIVYVENPKESTKKIMCNKFRKFTEFKINVPKSSLCINNHKLYFKKIFTVASEATKYSVLNLTNISKTYGI